MGNPVEFLGEIKKFFKIIDSDCKFEHFSDGTRIENETIAFRTDWTKGADGIKELCAILEIIYIFDALRIGSAFVDLYVKILPRKEGSSAIFITKTLVDSIFLDYEEAESTLKELFENFKKETEYSLSVSPYYKFVFLDRVKWEVRDNLCRRRLGIGMIGKTAKRMKLVVNNALDSERRKET